MLKLARIIRGMWIKWKVLGYLGVSKRKRFKHLIVTDFVALSYWESLYRLSNKP